MMRRSIFGAPARTSLPPTRTAIEPFLSATGVVLVALVTVFALFSFAASYFAESRNVRTEFAFNVPTSFYVVIPIAWIAVASIFQTRRWFVAAAIALILSTLSSPPLAWSGPGYMLDAVMPLVHLRMALGTLFVLISITIASVRLAVANLTSKRRV